MTKKLITGPSIEPLTLLEVKEHLRIDSSAEDELLTALIKSAREWCENYQNRAYITQTWELVLDDWPFSDSIEIPLPPLQSITDIKYKDSTEAEITWPASNYIVDTDSYLGRVVLAYGSNWPSVSLYPTGAIRIRFVAGYGDAAADVPARVKQAMKLLIGHWYDRRETVLVGSISKELEFTVKALLGQDRVVPI